MRGSRRTKLLLRLAPSVGLLWIAGCVYSAVENLDILLGLDATSNLLRLPYSSVFGLVQILARLLA